MAVLLALAAATAYGIALWKAPGWMHATKAQDRYNARVLVISVGGAAVVGVGLLYTARNYRLSHRGQVTERFTNTLERLGSGELYVRIGGVHALEHVMRDSVSHHDDVVEVLAAFIRDRVPATHQPGSHAWMHPVTASVDDLPPQPEPDVQAALTAIAQRPRRRERRNIDLTGLHLALAQLSGANLTRAQLSGANLTGAYLSGANLTRAGLDGTDLTLARLSRANLTRAELPRANLTRAELREANLAGAELGSADLTGAKLPRANLTRAWLPGANLTRAELEFANLTRAWLPGANLTRARLRGAYLTRAELRWADLTGAYLGGANLTGAELGADPPGVPAGWIVINRDTGELAPAPAQDT